MRLRAGLGLLCVALAGCQHVPEGVKIDLHNRVVEVGPCRCRLPVKDSVAPADPPREPEAPVEPAADAPR